MRKLSRAILLSFLSLALTTAGLAFAVYPKDSEKAYREILSFSKSEKEDLTTHQDRKNVSKFYMQGGKDTRGILCVNCDTSTLYLKPSMGLGETMEEMHAVQAVWKKSTEEPSLYNLHAEKAIFYPKLKHLTMEKVSAHNETAKVAGGVEVVNSGTAIYDGELLHLSDGMNALLKNMEISAEKATFYPRKNEQKVEVEKIFLSGHVHIKSRPGNPPMDLTAAQLNWDLNKKNLRAQGSSDTQVHCEDESSSVDGDQLDAKMKEVSGSLQIDHLTIRGNVKLQSLNKPNPQFAVAETLEYTPQTSTWVLSATPPRRVLYYDKANSVTISAPRVIVKQNEGQQKPYVKATGDVRFVFGEKELTELQQRFQPASKTKP